MDEKDIIELTGRVYKQTLLFPKKEPLRYKIRETADNILSSVIEWQVGHKQNPGKLLNANISEKRDIIFEVEKNLELIKSYFKLAKWQNWISYFDILKLEEEYKDLEGYFKKQVLELSFVKEKPVAPKKEITEDLMDERKNKIISILKEKGKIQVKDIKDAMPNVSKRTIRRDFDVLLEKKLVKRLGENNNTFYELIR